jgi:hypothetical protein
MCRAVFDVDLHAKSPPFARARLRSLPQSMSSKFILHDFTSLDASRRMFPLFFGLLPAVGAPAPGEASSTLIRFPLR